MRTRQQWPSARNAHPSSRESDTPSPVLRDGLLSIESPTCRVAGGVEPAIGGREKFPSRHPGSGSAGRRRRDQDGLYPPDARLPSLSGACGSGLRRRRPLLGDLGALRAAVRGGEPAPGNFSRMMDGGCSDAACQCAAVHCGCGPELQGLDNSGCATEQPWVLSELK